MESALLVPVTSSADFSYWRKWIIRICLDFTANKFHVILFSLFEALFTIFALFVLANRPLFAATKQCKSAQKHLSTKLEIKSKQILTFRLPNHLFFVFSWITMFIFLNKSVYLQNKKYKNYK